MGQMSPAYFAQPIGRPPCHLGCHLSIGVPRLPQASFGTGSLCHLNRLVDLVRVLFEGELPVSGVSIPHCVSVLPCLSRVCSDLACPGHNHVLRVEICW